MIAKKYKHENDIKNNTKTSKMTEPQKFVLSSQRLDSKSSKLIHLLHLEKFMTAVQK